MNKKEKELIDNYIQGSKVYSNGEIKDKETMVKAINELAEYYNKKFHFETALIKLNRIKDGDTTYKFDEIEATELLNYINQLEEENQQLQNDLDSANSKVSELANKLLQVETIIKYDLKYYEKDVVVRDLNTILKMIGSDPR